MKLFSVFSTLLAVTTVTAKAIDRSLVNPSVSVDSHAAVEKRNFVQTGALKFWTSNNNGKFQFRLLGGLRIAAPMLDMLGNNGLELSRAFFADWRSRNIWIRVEEGWTALYKSGNGPDAGMVGLQFEVGEFVGNNGFQRIVDAVNGYFRDNNFVTVDHLPVADAFNIGGPLQLQQAKRSELGERSDTCTLYDFSSWFRQFVEWDPDAPIWGHAMCDIPAGTKA